MPIGHGDVEREGPPRAVGKDKEFPALFKIQIPLNIAPDNAWIDCFKNPRTRVLDETNPGRAEVWGKVLEYAFSEENLKKKIEQIDKYISQANECYRRKMAEREVEMKRQEEEAKKEKEQLNNISKILEKL